VVARGCWDPYDGGVAADELLDRIVIDPAIAFGKPTVRGTRIWVGLVLGLLADGMTAAELLAEYPSLTEEDVRACLAYGARASSGRYVEVA
jgi:uncharacterized protein (DUF433 family)